MAEAEAEAEIVVIFCYSTDVGMENTKDSSRSLVTLVTLPVLLQKCRARIVIRVWLSNSACQRGGPWTQVDITQNPHVWWKKKKKKSKNKIKSLPTDPIFFDKKARNTALFFLGLSQIYWNDWMWNHMVTYPDSIPNWVQNSLIKLPWLQGPHGLMSEYILKCKYCTHALISQVSQEYLQITDKISALNLLLQ